MMIKSFLLTGSLTLCWTLSPDVLVLLGNNFGQHGKAFLFVLLAGAVFSAAVAYTIHHPALAPVGDDRQNIFPGTKTAVFPATLRIAGRLSPPLLFSTGMLVTAGFTFNETFVYWFPNFGFSFLLLALVVVVHICGEKMVLAAQHVFFGLTASCLLILILAGLLIEPTLPAEPAVPAETTPVLLTFVTLTPSAMLFFLGYDQQLVRDGGNSWNFAIAVGLGFALLALWGLVSLQHAPQARLAESSVPYVIGAKAILGQPGRLIMGIAIISGACGAVNGLFYLAVGTVRRILAVTSTLDPTRANLSSCSWLAKIQVLLMALVIALLMALGLAGSKNLEVYIFGSLLLWFLANGADCLAAAAQLRQQQRNTLSSPGYVMGGLILAAVAYLAFTYAQVMLLIGFCVSVLIASGLISSIWRRSGRKRNPAITAKGDIS